MPDEKKKRATEMTTEEAARHLFGDEATEQLKRIAREQERKGKTDASSQE